MVVSGFYLYAAKDRLVTSFFLRYASYPWPGAGKSRFHAGNTFPTRCQNQQATDEYTQRCQTVPKTIVLSFAFTDGACQGPIRVHVNHVVCIKSYAKRATSA